MKIGILTLPLHTNYGGILQAFALQRTLHRLGHETILVNLPLPQPGKKERGKEFFKRLVKKCLLFKSVPLRAWPTLKEREIISQYITPFIRENLKVLECPDKNNLLKLTLEEGLEGYVVGSDQVWRPAYSASVSSFFLDFLEDFKLKKISYAASFGVDTWPFTDWEREKFGKLLNNFTAVSVREDSAVSLCKTYWNINAHLVLDPTLLLDPEDYVAVCDVKGEPEERKLMVYILDKSQEKKNVIHKISQVTGLPLHEVTAKEKFWNAGSKGIDKCIVPSISEWIAGFRNAGFVVTDSFHGMVFSILFKKTFICIGNKKRGITRFTSLLKLLKLEDRLIYSPADIDENKIKEPINYERVDLIRQQERAKSLLFISEALKK